MRFDLKIPASDVGEYFRLVEIADDDDVGLGVHLDTRGFTVRWVVHESKRKKKKSWLLGNLGVVMTTRFLETDQVHHVERKEVKLKVWNIYPESEKYERLTSWRKT